MLCANTPDAMLDLVTSNAACLGLQVWAAACAEVSRLSYESAFEMPLYLVIKSDCKIPNQSHISPVLTYTASTTVHSPPINRLS